MLFFCNVFGIKMLKMTYSMATLHCRPLECMCPGCILEYHLGNT